MTAVPARSRVRSIAVALARGARPKQWLKNGMVFTAPLASGTLLQLDGLLRTLVAFAVFCVAASGTYLINDASDAESDRAHPAKRYRPVAAGLISVRAAATAGTLAIGTALACALLALGWRFAAVVFGYLVLSTTYTLWLRRIAVADLAAVASCHVLRALGGAVAVGVGVTNWYLLVVSMGALTLVMGKRESELRSGGTTATRATLDSYTIGYLVTVRATCSGVMIVTYCLWAAHLSGGIAPTVHAAGIVPFLLAVLRLNLLIDRGDAEEPDALLLHDRQLQLYLAALAACQLVGSQLR
ncbi:decaprenyl-phosphate phosphoribosyltransferase [Lentzea sp. HUAS TT2]|uniref:decaprenyl-phosphate phosphoribosyltransferase n=1 Tax=Lentzea sp. HUAS TT2 TaxID=3447454 RepID=UPI003F72948A